MLDLKIGHPKELGGKHDGPNPDQLFAIAYSSCLLGAIKLVDCNVLITNEATARELLIRRRG